MSLYFNFAMAVNRPTMNQSQISDCDHFDGWINVHDVHESTMIIFAYDDLATRMRFWVACTDGLPALRGSTPGSLVCWSISPFCSSATFEHNACQRYRKGETLDQNMCLDEQQALECCHQDGFWRVCQSCKQYDVSSIKNDLSSLSIKKTFIGYSIIFLRILFF